MGDVNKISWPGWEVLRVIGRGSFGAVYEIQREVFGRTEKAALKVISIPQSDDEIQELYREGFDSASITTHFKRYLEDIVREYSLMLDLKGHTNVVYCDDLRYIQHDDGIGWDIYIKMELLSPLKMLVGKDYDEQQTRRLAVDMCQALMVCQSQNIVHRDIKPENIFVSRTGDYKLGDFGVAKVSEKTASGTKIGTYEYMAPEVYKGQAYGIGADIYSLGLVLYWMMNNKRSPFLYPAGPIPTATEKEQARGRRCSGEAIPDACNGSQGLKAIVRKACAYDARLRYATAEEMLQDLRRLESGYFGENERTVYAAEEATVQKTEPVRPTQTEPVQSGAYHQAGGFTKEFVGRQTDYSSQASAYQQTGTYQQPNAYQQTNAYQQQAAYQQTYQQANVYQQQVAYQSANIQTGGKKKSGRIALIVVITVVVLGLVGGLVALLPKAFDSVRGFMEDRDTGKASREEDTEITADVQLDEDDLTLQEILDYSDGSFMEISVNGEGQQVLREYYDRNGSLVYRFEGAYDACGKLGVQQMYDGNGTLIGTKQITYDKEGNVLLDASEAADGSFSYRLEYDRDSNGVLIQTRYYENDWLVDWTDFVIEDDKIVESYTYDGQDNLIQQGERFYREDGSMEKVITYDIDGSYSIGFYNEKEHYLGSEQYDVYGNLESFSYYELNEEGWRLSGETMYLSYSGQEVRRNVEFHNDGFGSDYYEIYYINGEQDSTTELVYDLFGNYWKDYYESVDGYKWITTYNYAGKMQEELYYLDGVLEEHTVYTYTDGLLTKKTVCDKNGELLSEEEFLYDDAGFQTGSKERYNFDDGGYCLYTYNLDGQITEVYYYDAAGNLESYNTSVYDTDGKELECYYYDENNVLFYREVYSYNNLGQRVRIEEYDGDGNLQGYSTYEYDAAGNGTVSYYYDASGELTSWVEYTYDEYGYYLDSQWYYP